MSAVCGIFITSVGPFPFQERKKYIKPIQHHIFRQTHANMHAPRSLMTLVKSCSSTIHKIPSIWLKLKPFYLDQTLSGISRQSLPGFPAPRGAVRLLLSVGLDRRALMNTLAAESPGVRHARRQGLNVLLTLAWVFSRHHFPPTDQKHVQ